MNIPYRTRRKKEVAEGMNRTILDTSRTIMLGTKFEKNMWTKSIIWLVTINRIKLLFERVHSSGYKYLIPPRVHQDCLENFFEKIRQQGGYINPTPIQL